MKMSQMKEKEILEVYELKTARKVLMLSIEVPPLCTPMLVGNPKGTKGNMLKWVEKIPSNNNVITWGLADLNEGEILAEIKTKVLERSHAEGWDILCKDLPSARARMRDQGIDETKQIEDILVPKDPSLLGSVIFIGDLCFPVIHNVSRGLLVIKDNG
jgi:hypothetical protein